MDEPLMQEFFRSLAYKIPYILVYLSGIIAACFLFKHCRKAAILSTVAFVILIGNRMLEIGIRYMTLASDSSSSTVIFRASQYVITVIDVIAGVVIIIAISTSRKYHLS